MWPLTFLVSIAFSQSQVGEPGCNANYAYIYVESTLSTTAERVLNYATERVLNYAPYYSQTVPHRKLVSFAGNELMTDTSNNLCDITTWSTPSSSYYDNATVILEYSSYFASICSPQQWTLNLQNYNTNIQALLISNNADLFNVYPLPGDESLASPTRMISQSSAANILNITGKEDVFISIDCFNTTSSPIICVVDDSLIGSDVELDGEFQKQADISVNDHPVWLKEGINRVWDDYYIWLAVDHSANTNALKWVIGQNYNDDTIIIVECLAPDIDDPRQCGPAWYRNGVPISRLRSTDGVCDLGDPVIWRIVIGSIKKGVNPRTETKMCIKIWLLFYITFFQIAYCANNYFILALGKCSFEECIHCLSWCRFMWSINWLSLLLLNKVILVELLMVSVLNFSLFIFCCL